MMLWMGGFNGGECAESFALGGMKSDQRGVWRTRGDMTL